MAPLIIALLANSWIWRLIITNVFTASAVTAASWTLWKRSRLFLLFLILLLFFQFRATQKTSLTYLDNDSQRVVQMRLREYPYDLVRIGHIVEERPEAIALFKIRDNLFQNLDLNHFFFAGFPRQTVGIAEFEKFPYIFLPFFVIGIVKSVKTRIDTYYLTSFFIPLITLAIIGNKNSLGPFSLFPFFVVNIARGFKHDQN